MLRQWIHAAGITEDDWEQITLEDRQYDYLCQSPGVGVSYEIGEGDDTTGDVDPNFIFQ